MRQRNVKNKKEILENSGLTIENPATYCGKWKTVFNNDNPIHIEIGSGKCRFIVEKAIRYPNINFIGIEKMESVLALGIKNIKEDVPNLRLISFDAKEIDTLFDREIDVIYLNFSDPWPKVRHEKRRLTHSSFLKRYDLIFKGIPTIVQKTDNQSLFEYSIVSLSNYGYKIKEVAIDLHKLENSDNIMTEYEEKFSKKGSKIFMIKAQKNKK